MSKWTHKFSSVIKSVGFVLSYFSGDEVEGKKGFTKERRKGEMDLHSMSRKLVVLAFAAALLVGTVSVADAAVSIDSRPLIRLIGDEEPVGKPGNGMVSIGDTIVIEVTLTPGNIDSVSSVLVDWRKYGGDEAEVLSAFTGSPASITADVWVPTCSGSGTALMTDPVLYHTDLSWMGGPSDTVLVRNEHWEVCYDPISAGGPFWRVNGNLTGTLPTPAYTDSLYWAHAGTDTFFSFTITDTSGICCTNPAACNNCDHFEFETFAEVGPDTVWADTLIVSDADMFWIDNTPCDYIGHRDASVVVTAYMANGYWDSLSSYRQPANEAGLAYVNYDTHHTTYINPWTRLYPTEFDENVDYFLSFDTDNAGNGAIFGEPDMILNPACVALGLPADTACVHVDMRNLAHENGNDDILFLCFDAHLLGQAYADSGWWHVDNPNYVNVDCVWPVWNGVPPDEIWRYCFPILEDTTDVEADSVLAMMWISDSGDTTWFETFTDRLLAIDNQVPDWIVADSPTDSVVPWDIGFVARTDNAGDPDILNPVSVGNPIADWLQVTVDLGGLFDLPDVEDGGRAFANMQHIGWNLANTAETPFGDDNLAPMHFLPVLAPVWGTDSTDVVASPPSPHGYDQDSILSEVHIFDNAGNYFYVGRWDSTLAIDNQLPWCDSTCCLAGPHIWCEIADDAATKLGYANVGQPVDNIHGNPYDNRDRIILHANLGDLYGADEIMDVVLQGNPYCNDPALVLYDDGLHGTDMVLGDKNYTGQTMIQVAGIAAGVCALDTDELTQQFVVLVTDDAGNAAYDSSCIDPKVDNEPPTMTAENVAIMFWDDPETFGVDGDKDGDGIVTNGDQLVFEWKAENEVWDDTEIDSVKVDLASIDPTYSGHIYLWWNPSGGVYRNWWPDAAGGPDTVLYTVTPGSIDGGTLCADFKVWDNAGNTNGWQSFCSGLTLDNYAPMIACGDMQITIAGLDPTCAAVGDVISFYYDGVDYDVAEIGVLPGDLTDAVSDTLWLVQGASWSGSFTVDAGSTENPAFTFSIFAKDDVGNDYNCTSNPICVDNMAPSMSCANAYVRLWDYVDNIPDRIVNCNDNLTAIYFDIDGDVVSVAVDFSNYGTSIGTGGVADMVFGFDGGPAYKWGYRVDPVPEGTVDQGPGGLGTLVMLTAIDDAGNTTSMWLCPIWFDETVLPDPIASPGDTVYACTADCCAVDTECPGLPDPSAITFELLETSNGIANVGDRLRIIVDMGDPTGPGYDMQWETASVEADISQYGTAYFSDYIDLVDDGYSAGGEGDGKFSYFFFHDPGDGRELVEGAPILPGGAQLAAGDPGTRIRIRAKDDAGNYSAGWVYSDVLVAANGQAFAGDPVPVDNLIPTVDPNDISISFTDRDANGICDIGDSVKIAVDMTDAPGGGVVGVWANLFDWGYPSTGMVELIAQPPVYEIEFEVGRNPGDFCIDGVLFEDEACPRVLLGDSQPHPEVEVVAKDASDNWSEYENADRPGVLLGVPAGPLWLWLGSWPFVYDWTSSGWLTMIADTDDPDPVNPSFDHEEATYWICDIKAAQLVDGRVGLDFWYVKSPRNIDVERFFVYRSDAGGVIDLSDYLGEPIYADHVPTSAPLDSVYEWISDPTDGSIEYLAVLAVDNAGNTSDPLQTYTVAVSGDVTYPTAYVRAFMDEDEAEGVPTDIGDQESYFHAYLNEDEYWDVCYVQYYARVQDVDALLGDGPGPWTLIYEVGEHPANPPLPTPPYACGAGRLPVAFPDMTSCTTFEIIAIPWDVAGNYQPKDEAERFVFTYDNWDPVITWFTVNGVSAPQSLEALGSVEVEALAYDECPENGELDYMLYLSWIGGVDITDQMLARETLAPGETFTYTWDLTNYPGGIARVDLRVDDEAHTTWEFQLMAGPEVNVLDESAPGGVLASAAHPDNAYQEGAHWPSDWDFDFYFLVEWPEIIGTANYDVGEVSVDYMVQGSADWVPIGTKSAVPGWVGPVYGAYWYPYNFAFDTSIFTTTTVLDVRATIMDHTGNTEEVIMSVTINPAAPDMAMEITEAVTACGYNNMIPGTFDIIATETVTSGVDTRDVKVWYKSHDDPDIHSSWMTLVSDLEPTAYTNETVWRKTVTWPGGSPDGMYDLLLGTTDVAGNNSWDLDSDGLIDPGAFGSAPAGMKMTVYVQTSAPSVRLWTLNEFDAIDLGTVLYVQCGNTATATSMTERTCDVAKVDYFLTGGELIDDPTLVGSSTSGPGYDLTFPASGDICDLLDPDALWDGYASVGLKVQLTDVLGNVSSETYSMVLLDQDAASAFIFIPSDGECVRDRVELKARVVDDEKVYDVTYEYRTSGSADNWTHIATTQANDGTPWNHDLNGDRIYWYTNLLADGAYDLRAVSRDANLLPDPNPPEITVHVDNNAPVVALTLDEAVVIGNMTFIGGAWVDLTADVDDGGGCGTECVTFSYKKIEWDWWETVREPDCYTPFSIHWDESGDDKNFCRLKSGMWDILAEAEDKAGNIGHDQQTVYVDHWAPEAWVTTIEDAWGTTTTVTTDDPCCCYDVWGVITLSGLGEDDVPNTTDYVGNLKYDSGIVQAQFQYREYDFEQECGYIDLRATQDGYYEWFDLGEPVNVGQGEFSKDWDTGMLAKGHYLVRVIGIDAVGNRYDADCGWGYAPPPVCIHVTDMIPPVAVIAGVDEVTGYVWAVVDDHDQNDVAFVRFEFMEDGGVAWTEIGEVDEYQSDGVYGVPWHYIRERILGSYWVRAVAYGKDWDPVFRPDMYDQDPAMMMITIAADGVTMATTTHIESLTRWGNLARCDWVTAKVVSVDEPTLIVVYDSDPEDDMNEPWAWLRHLERPDDPKVWVDDFDLNSVDPWGNVTIIATHNDSGVVGAMTSMIKVFKYNEREGTKGAVSQDGMTVDIPSGAVDTQDGLLIIQVPKLFADPSITDPVAIGGPVMMTLLDHGYCDHYHFDNGVRAHVKMTYDSLEIPYGYAEEDLRIAFWDQDCQEWIFDGDVEFAYPEVDVVNDTVSVYVDQTGTYSVVATKPIRITRPIFDPRCACVQDTCFTGVWPTFCTIIEDLKYDYINEIMVVLDGPAEDEIFDEMIIYHGGGEEYEGDGDWWDYASEVSYGAGWFGAYDPVANRLCMRLVPESEWSDFLDYWYGYEDWFMFFGDIISDGLPAGTYTLDITAQNEMGDTEHLTHTFMVDATPPAVQFVDVDGMPGPKYVDTYPTFYLEITDGESGMNLDEVYLDVFIVEPNGSNVEDEELLGTITPSAMTYDAGMGYLIAEFGEIYRDELPQGYSLDVVAYNGEWTSCPDDDCEYGDCRCYYNEHGVADCAENHATPVWRRFTVKRTEDPGPVIVTGVISYPNPFDPAGGECATISFSTTKSSHLTIAVYDFAGQHVRTIADDWYSSGNHEFTWCGTNGSGETVASGAYIGYFKVDDNMKVVTKTLKIGVVNGGND